MEMPDGAEVPDYYYSPGEENDTLCAFVEWGPSFSIIPLLYMVVFILGLTGNGAVIVTVWRCQSKRRAADVYMGHLALADLTSVVTLPMWAVYAALEYHWPFGTTLCKLSSYLVLLNMYASVFCLSCMSFDRYLSIVRPLSAARLRSRVSLLISLACVWAVSGLLAAPALLFRTTRGSKEGHVACVMDFSLVVGEDSQREESWMAGLSLSSSVLGFLLPFLAMTVCYCFIGHKVERHFGRVRREERRRRRLLRTIVTLVLVFTICWTPLHLVKSLDALSYLQLAPSTCGFLTALLQVHPYSTCLAYLNACLNPFLYAFFDPRFRSQCRTVVGTDGSTRSSAASLSSQTPKCDGQTVATKCEVTVRGGCGVGTVCA